jgi:hypothetical protein
LEAPVLVVKKCKYGRGIFTTASIDGGEVLLFDHLLLLKPEDRQGSLTLCRYDFEFEPENCSGIALGLASLINHSVRPNADFETGYDRKGLPRVIVTAIKDIKRGSQIFIDYGYDPRSPLCP